MTASYVPRLLPEIKVSPVPEVIFLSTIKALVVPAANLSPSQWGTVGLFILLTNISPTLRKATVKLYGYLTFVIATEIALINAYVLVSLFSHPHLSSLISSAKGLFMDLTLDNTATPDGGHLERLE